MLKALYIVLSIVSGTITTAQGTRLPYSESRIVHGVNVTPTNKYPMMARLFKNDGRYVCTGTILSKHYVLTGHSCINNVVFYGGYVLAGVYNAGDPDPRYLQNTSVREGYEYTIEADNWIVKGYKPFQISILRVETPFVWNAFVNPTNLPDPDWTIPDNKEIKAIAVGWGYGINRTYPYDPVRPLQEVELPVLTTEQCQREQLDKEIHDELICTESVGGAGPCKEDNGGPLFIYNEESERLVQIGINVWAGKNCGNTSEFRPAGYTKVSNYVHWITWAVRECNYPRPLLTPDGYTLRP